MSSTLKRSGKPDIDNFLSQTGTNDAATHYQEIGIVVKAAHPGGIQFLTEGGTDSWKTIRGDGHAQAGAADEDAATSRIRQYGLNDLISKIGIVDRDFFTITSQISYRQRQVLAKL